MSDMNIERGQQLFLKRTTEVVLNDDKDGQGYDRLQQLRENFQDKVAVMPSDVKYGAARLAKACVQVAGEFCVPEEEMVERAIQYYHGDLGTSIRPTERKELQDGVAADLIPGTEAYARRLQNEATSKSLQQEIDENNPTIIKNMIIVDDKGNKKTLEVDNIDLVESIDRAMLSVEGKRALKLLPGNYDTLSGDDVQELDDATKIGAVSLDDSGDIVVSCPDCGSSEIYVVGLDVLGCFNCDTEFTATLSLGDNLPVDSLTDSNELQSNLSIGRVSGKIQNRGRKLL